MWQDPIVDEIRRVREEHAVKFNYDLHAIFEDLRARESQYEGQVVSLPPRRTFSPPNSASQGISPEQPAPASAQPAQQEVA